jgi:predicted nuclease of predicted toxin-antitoxin system
VLNLFTGGAHCCTVGQVLSQSRTGTWSVAEHNFADAGYRIETMGTGSNAARVFVTQDDAFAYAFTDFADSGEPIQILSLSSGRFANVTSRYRSAVKADAAKWLAAYKHMAPKYANTVGVIAAWAADEATLGNAGHAFGYLDQQASRHRLNGGPFPVTKGGKVFVAKLHGFLAKRGYLR